MALTSYFNWETCLQPDLINLNLQHQTSIFNEATPEEELLLLPPDYYNPLLPPNYNNYYSDENYSSTTDFLYPLHEDYHYEHHNNLYNYYNEDDLLLLPCPKRQKYYDESTINVVPNIIPEFNHGGCGGCCGGRKKKNSSSSSNNGNVGPPGVSAQSKAARERRRKITEKTQELGKLVPAASNLNTADMLQAAAKYLAYLKAQVGMLQLVNTMQDEKALLSGSEDLKAMLVSPCVEEKLCLKEKCLVPKEFVTTLKNLQEVKSKPSILNDLNQLIQTESEEKKIEII
ncbi:transcription factor bHLH52-like [Senna tora]|uniref:Transcription factor bHLH52-like n=1 Tax=Senna tora TaxID=362788 RepID=A0A834WYT7_9FABA|nr:transcription factor bHLH52-like [Senna tora]